MFVQQTCIVEHVHTEMFIKRQKSFKNKAKISDMDYIFQNKTGTSDPTPKNGLREKKGKENVK